MLFVFPSVLFFSYLNSNLNHFSIWRLPFEWKNLAGYLLLAFPIQCLECFCLVQYSACFLTLAFGHTIFVLAFFKDMINCLHLINESGRADHIKIIILKQFVEIDSVMKMLSFSLAATNWNRSLFHHVFFLQFQNIGQLFRCLSNNNSDFIHKQHNYHLYGFFAASSESSLVI